MKIYRFYVPAKYIHQLTEQFGITRMSDMVETLGNDVALYAFTHNKKYAQEFRDIRNMDVFMERSTDMDKEEYASFANEFRYGILDKASITTRGVNKNGQCVASTTNILMNDYENMIFSNGSMQDPGEGLFDVDSEYFWHSCPHPAMFRKNSLRKALDVLEYSKFYKIWTGDSSEYSFAPPDSMPADDYDAPDVVVDELSVFIKLFDWSLG